MLTNEKVHVNRKYKDTVFRMLFGENKENALSLYNAVNGSFYSNINDLEFTTLDDVIYMKGKNDVSFIFDEISGAHSWLQSWVRRKNGNLKKGGRTWI